MPGQVWFLLLGGTLCALGALGGIFAERRRLQFIIRDQAARNVSMTRRLTEMERIHLDAQKEQRMLAHFLVVLPDVVRGLNQNNSRRNIPPLLINTLEHLFEPEQSRLYLTAGKGELVLAAGKGLPGGLPMGTRVGFGQGRIGLVASHQVAMDRDDMNSESTMRRSSYNSPEHPGTTVDLVAPIVHEGETLGVICIGKASKRHRDEKKMIKLVADLGSLALSNVALFTRLENLANRDSLTGLSTKRFLNIRLGELTNKAQQTHNPLSIIIMDIDFFKKFNDTFGHLAGDNILRGVARVVRDQLRGDDLPARYGGEEFVVVLPDTSKKDALAIAEKIRAAIEAHPFQTSSETQGTPGTVTVSAGVACFNEDGRASQEILAAADQALYLAKEQGRNRVVEYKSRYLSEEESESEMLGY